MTSSPVNAVLWRPVDWLGLHIETPDEWEIVRHSTNIEKGTLIWVDRRRQRMQLSWTACSVVPDVARIFDDFRALDRQRDANCSFSESFRLRRWVGYRCLSAGKVLTRAGCYERQYGRWIDLALPWVEEVYDQEVERAVMESFRVVKPEDGSMRLDAFDVAVTVPPLWRLVEAEVAATRVTLHLKRGQASALVRRIAMPEAWYDGHPDVFLRRQALPITGQCSLTTVSGHPAASFVGKERVVHPRWLWGKRKERHDLAWECPSDHAVYHVVVTRYPCDGVEPSDFPIGCCRRSRGVRQEAA